MIFDISEVDDDDLAGFSLTSPDVLVIKATSEANHPAPLPVHTMNATDDDGDWTFPDYMTLDNFLPVGVLAVQSQGLCHEKVEVVVDSGADVSVAPLKYRNVGKPAKRSHVVTHDAQGKRIPETQSRVIDIEVEDEQGEKVTIREKFAIAKVGSVILSLGRLLRWGWQLGHGPNGPVITRGMCKLPIHLRRNTLTMLAVISTITACSVSSFDTGSLPPEVEDCVALPGWHIVPSRLPVKVQHSTSEIDLDEYIWSAQDWQWAAVFVKVEESKGVPHVETYGCKSLPCKVSTWKLRPLSLKSGILS